MASVVKLKRIVLLMAAAVLLSSACSTLVNLNLKPESYVSPQRDALLPWYDETHLIYYDLHGPVRSLHRVIQVDGRPVEWVWQFNRRGRLSQQGPAQGGVQTHYRYDNQQRLREVAVKKDQEDLKSSVYQFQGNVLHTVAVKDMVSGEETRFEYQHQPIASGYFVTSQIRYGVDNPRDQLFSDDGTLLWSSHSTYRTGPDQSYQIPTHDQVTSPKVESRGSKQMVAHGGYKFEYYPDGRLAAVISYNANKQRLYHRTDYRYSNYGLLLEERKHVSDYSVYNSASDMAAIYHYQAIDAYGNWLQRVATITQKLTSNDVIQDRYVECWGEADL